MVDLAAELSETFQDRARTTDLLEVEFRPSAKLSYFADHFPQLPVLPAYGILDISQFFIAQLTGSSGSNFLSSMLHFRIKAPVQPGDVLCIRVQREKPNRYSVTWESADDQKLIADLNLQLSPRANP